MYKIIGGDHREYGPVPAEDVARWIAEGRLGPQSLIQLEGTGEWKPVLQYPEFAEELAGQRREPPPAAVPVTPGDFQGWIADILARPAQLDIGSCLRRGGALMGANLGLFLGGAVVVSILGFLALIPSVLGLPFQALSFVLEGVLRGAFFLLILNRLRGQPASLSGMFQGLGDRVVQLILAGVVSCFLTYLGVCAFCVGFLYLLVAWVFCVPLVADKKIEFWTAMEVSRRVVTRIWFPMAVLLLLAFLPFLVTNVALSVVSSQILSSQMKAMPQAGQTDLASMLQGLMQVMSQNEARFRPIALGTQAALLLNLPFAFSVLMCAYEDLFGPRPTPGA